MSFNTLKRKPLVWLYGGGVVLLLVGAWLWWAKLCTNPERIFWGMIEQGLATSGVTIEAQNSNNGTDVHQTIQYSLGGSNLSHAITTIKQQGTTVKNEMIGTLTVDYTRYAYVQTDQKRADGKPIDFSKIIGVWAKSTGGKGQFFSQAVLGTSLPLGGMAVPIGNLGPELRHALANQIRGDRVYHVSFDNVKKERLNGRQVYTYDASIQPLAYARLMKQFAQDAGLHDLDTLDPNTFSGQQPLKLRLSVDIRSRQVVKVAVPDSAYQQTYSAYDVPARFEPPKQAITTDELQKRLMHLQ